MQTHHILVFDSGLGGLSIVSAIAAQQPETTISYVADNALFPYGEQDDEAIINNCLQVLTALNTQLQPAIIVIACNTASTLVLPTLRASFNCPIVGVVPAIKPAAKHSKSGNIGLLATPATVNRQYTDQLINDFASGCNVKRIGSTALVELAESGTHGDEAQALIKQELSPWLGSKTEAEVDTIVLGCTHFPLIRDLIQTVTGNGVTLIDSGNAVARQTAKLLAESECTRTHQNTSCFYHTAALTASQKSFVQHYGFSKTEQLCV